MTIDEGSRRLEGKQKVVILSVAFIWSLFQLWISSPLPFSFNVGIFNNTESRAIHLAFAIFLAFIFFPAGKTSSKERLPIRDWIFAILSAFATAYIYFNYAALSHRSGVPITFDLVTAFLGMVLLMEATRRVLGPPLMVVAFILLIYTFAGQYMPDVIAHKSQSVQKILLHQWLTTEGVFGVALGVSSEFVFLFVLFGVLLEKSGAGNYFIKVAFALLGHLKGGPAKAAVLASASTGLVSGSSIANVVTTGTFTIPLMKKIGFSGVKAGAIEVAASTNGQLTPPVMGAAAFLMVEYVGIPYEEVIKHAALPAIISYIALLYIVHLEALKYNMQGLPRRTIPTVKQKILSFLSIIIGMSVIACFVFYGMGWLKDTFPETAFYIAGLTLLIAYIALLFIAAKFPKLTVTTEITELPKIKETINVGLHFLLPIAVLMWCLVVERLSPSLSAFWATLLMIFILITQQPILAFLRKETINKKVLIQGFIDLIQGMINASKNMIGIAVATATAGIVVGTITLTGIGQVMIELVELMSMGSLFIALVLTAIICLILGMGLPTTANYIVVSSLMAPVIVHLGSANGLIIPLIAVHMFVFYFGILADDTPPVGLAAFAAAAISKSDPIKTGIQGFTYDIRTAVLPFMFIFNTQLLLIDIHGWFELISTIFSAMAAILLFAAATQGYWLTKSKKWETLCLLLIALTLFRPGFWLDKIQEPFNIISATEIYKTIDSLPKDSHIRMLIAGETMDGKYIEKTVRYPLGNEGNAKARLLKNGLAIRQEKHIIVDKVIFASKAQSLGFDFDWEIKNLQLKNKRINKQWLFIPALILLFWIWLMQKKRL
jgi:TRAP transporter 4TM/12TM fusion protein